MAICRIFIFLFFGMHGFLLLKRLVMKFSQAFTKHKNFQHSMHKQPRASLHSYSIKAKTSPNDNKQTTKLKQKQKPKKNINKKV
jgi:hypothetical protein